MLSSTRRWGSSPKFWNTIEKRRRRSSRSRSGLAFRMSSPSRSTSPSVGSMSRVRQRTSVDLPRARQAHHDEDLAGLDVERDVLARRSSPPIVADGLLESARTPRRRPAPARATFASAGPKTFQRSRTAIVGPPAFAVATGPGAAGGTADGPVTAVPGSTTEVTGEPPDRCRARRAGDGTPPRRAATAPSERASPRPAGRVAMGDPDARRQAPDPAACPRSRPPDAASERDGRRREMSSVPTQARVVIIGAGIVGNSMAWHLARLGWRDIVLLEKGTLPNPGGSTGHASNFIFLIDHCKEMAAFTIESARQYRELGVYNETGGIEVARTPERMEELKRRMASSTSWGVEGSRLLDPGRGQGDGPVHRRDRDPRRLLHAGRRRRRLAPGRDAHAPEGAGARRADGRGRRRGHRDRRRGRPRPARPHRRRRRSRPRSSSSPAASGARGSRGWPAPRSR